MIQPGCLDTIRLLRYKPAYWPLGDVVWPNIGRHRSWCLAKSGRNHEDVIKHCIVVVMIMMMMMMIW